MPLQTLVPSPPDCRQLPASSPYPFLLLPTPSAGPAFALLQSGFWQQLDAIGRGRFRKRAQIAVDVLQFGFAKYLLRKWRHLIRRCPDIGSERRKGKQAGHEVRAGAAALADGSVALIAAFFHEDLMAMLGVRCLRGSLSDEHH